MKKIFLTLSTAFLLLNAQDIDQQWQHQSMDENVPGVGTNKAYKELLAGKKSTKIVVAVIDSGVDIEHEDLKDVIWTNTDEIPGNGIDDDNNGYIDDIHGWNFLGNSKGENINACTLEMTRVLAKLKAKYEGKKEEEVSKKDKKEYELYLQLEEEVAANANQGNYADQIRQFAAMFPMLDEQMGKLVGKADYTVEDLKAYEASNDMEKQLVAQFIELKENGINSKEDLLAMADEAEGPANKYYDVNFDPRKDLGIPADGSGERFYGNNTYEGSDASHGTHVSGIIAAMRNNGIGMDGIADNVEIMVLRAVPDGDEFDQDIANSIRYAADNGAKVMNCSFGKAYSPYQSEVNDAIKYAQSKGVLIIKAAGNSNENIDEHIHYPTDKKANLKPYVKNVITVGASQPDLNNVKASFSNYGKKGVDIFAPGFQIYSTTPNNEYAKYNGTSMASPVVCGVAALVWSYYPELDYKEIKEILFKSGTDFNTSEVLIPNNEDRSVAPKKSTLGKISVTGKIVNVYEALKLAATY